MKVDARLGNLANAARSGAAIEEAGYDGAWSAEVSHDPFLPLAVAASATSSLELGTSIAVAFARSPMTLAYTAHDLQGFAQGRLLLGLGSQVKAHVTRRFNMPWGKPALQMKEFILAMRAIWQSWDDGTPLDFTGEHYQHTLMTPHFVPESHGYGAPRVLLAGVGELMTKVAGGVADGFLCHGFTTARYLKEKTLPALAEGRRQAGKTMEGFEIVGAPFAVTGTDEEIAAGVPKAREQIAFYASTPAYRPVLELHGWGDLGQELTAMSKQGRWKEMGEMIDDDVLAAFVVVAPTSEIATRLGERYRSIVTRLPFTPPQSADADAARELVESLRKG
ncbi:MAG: TIGR03617 family F420-dependent LLM class oxidoreductase [Acidobacteria bacterium]|nr:TIGR03617 family F420-dependent LLM class oxidoreductase [Acidobacteriota bacterium]